MRTLWHQMHSMTAFAKSACYCIVLKVQSFFAEFWTLCDSLGWPTCVLVNKGFLGVNILVDILEILEILDTKPLWIFVNVYEYEFIWAILVNRLNTTLLILFRKRCSERNSAKHFWSHFWRYLWSLSVIDCLRSLMRGWSNWLSQVSAVKRGSTRISKVKALI